MLKTIKQEENPVELNLLRRQIRRHVPIFLRSYFMTYLFKITLSPGVENKKAVTRLFVSIGKNRGVFANDLKALFAKSLHLDLSGIGDIKVLDNYSFVDIPSSLAEKAIQALSDTELKGRRIKVNYARKKTER